MENKRIVEICCGSYSDALSSFNGGAKRIELNSALHLGGLTPSLGSLRLTKENTDFETMLYDAKKLMENKSDGIAFGCLTPDFSIDIEQTKKMVDIIKHYNGEAVFHRAFDCTKDPVKSIELLIDLGVDRILTSGQQPKAIEGIALIKKLQDKYGDKIQILAGSGINKDNALTILETTGINQVHSSCKSWKEDNTTINPNNEKLNYSYTSSPHEKDYDIVSEDLVRSLTSLVVQ